MIKFFTKTKKVDGVTEVELEVEVKPLTKKKDCELRDEIEEEFMKRKLTEFIMENVLNRYNFSDLTSSQSYYKYGYDLAIDDLVAFVRTEGRSVEPKKK